MALEMKMGDVLIAGAFLLLVVGSLSSLFIGFDNSAGVTSISDDLIVLSGDVETNYYTTEEGLQDLSTNNTGFVVKENIFIDDRGTAEADFSRDNSQSSFKKFISNIRNNDKSGLIDPQIFIFATAFVILIVLILGFRAVFGNGRW